MVGGGSLRSHCCEPDDASVVHQLQLEERLVCLYCPDHHRRLESCEPEHLDGSSRRWRGTHFQTRAATGESFGAVLWKRLAPGRWFILGHAIAACVPVPQAATCHERETEGVGTKEMKSRIIAARPRCRYHQFDCRALLHRIRLRFRSRQIYTRKSLIPSRHTCFHRVLRRTSLTQRASSFDFH